MPLFMYIPYNLYNVYLRTQGVVNWPYSLPTSPYVDAASRGRSSVRWYHWNHSGRANIFMPKHVSLTVNNRDFSSVFCQQPNLTYRTVLHPTPATQTSKDRQSVKNVTINKHRM